MAIEYPNMQICCYSRFGHFSNDIQAFLDLAIIKKLFQMCRQIDKQIDMVYDYISYTILHTWNICRINSQRGNCQVKDVLIVIFTEVVLLISHQQSISFSTEGYQTFFFFNLIDKCHPILVLNLCLIISEAEHF